MTYIQHTKSKVISTFQEHHQSLIVITGSDVQVKISMSYIHVLLTVPVSELYAPMPRLINANTPFPSHK